MNLPEIEPIKKLFAISSYQEGLRVVLAYNEKENALIVDSSESRRRPGDSEYEKECGLRLDKEKGDAILQTSEHLVDESLILQNLKEIFRPIKVVNRGLASMQVCRAVGFVKRFLKS